MASRANHSGRQRGNDQHRSPCDDHGPSGDLARDREDGGVRLVVDERCRRVRLDDRRCAGALREPRFPRAHRSDESSGFCCRLDLVLLSEPSCEGLVGLHGARPIAELAEERDQPAERALVVAGKRRATAGQCAARPRHRRLGWMRRASMPLTGAAPQAGPLVLKPASNSGAPEMKKPSSRSPP